MSSTPAARRLTPATLCALLAVAAVAAALAAIRVESHDPITVPAGARPGQITLKPCTYPTERGDVAADCGTLVVPEHRQNAASRLIALPVTRIRARSAHPGAPIFRLEGGPGRTNMDFPHASRYTERHDLVLVGYRGVEGSSVLHCPEVEDARRRSGDLLGERSVRASAAAFGDCARRLRDGGADLRGYGLSERVEDLEAARRALGYRRIDLLSESAGTRTAMIYAWRHPERIHRSVMIGANPPGRFLYDQAATTAQLGRLSSLCAQDPDCPGRGEDAAASMRRTAADMPRRWGLLPIRPGNVLLGSFFGLAESSGDAAPVSAPTTLDSWHAATKGDASGLWFQSLAATLMFPRAWVWGEAASVARADADAATRHFAAAAPGTSPLGDAANRFLWAAGGMLREWPASRTDEAYARIRTSRVPTLVVSGTLDGATPVSRATRELLAHLPSGRHVVLPGFGHTVDFWSQQTAAGTRLITGFLDHGRVDDSAYTRQRVDFAPGLTQTTLAKWIVGTMSGLALVTLASLGWMARRARARRPFGTAASVCLRTLHAGLLGLGGWLLAALVAMVVAPDTPIDAELLVVLSIAVPAGLCVHWAAGGREGTAGARRLAWLGVLGGAVLGAWLGFRAPDSALGVLTAIPGAVAAANLAAILRRIAAPHPLPRSAAVPRAAGGGMAPGSSQERPRLLPHASPTMHP